MVTLLTELVREQRLALDGVSALSDLPAAVSQVKTDFPGDAMVRVSHLQQSSIPYGPFLL